MYVCICHGVTDHQIREVVDRGAVSLQQVQCQLPVAGCCGRCEETARDVIDQQLSDTRSRKVAA